MQKRVKKMYFKILALGMSGVVMATSFAGTKAFASSFQNQINDATDKKQELEDKKEALANKLKKLEGEKKDILTYIESLDTELSDLTDEISQLNNEIDEVNADLEETKAQLEEAKKTEENQYETMKKRIQYMYENGETSMLEVLLSSQNIADLLNQVEYVSGITDYDNNLLDRYKETKQKVEEMKSQLEQTLEEKNLLNDELTINQGALEEMITNKQTELAKYEANISETRTLSSEYDAQIAEQEDMIEDLLEQERKRIEEEERKRKEEEERKRKEEEERKKQEALQNQNSSSNSSSGSSSSSSSSSSSNTNVSTTGFLWPVPSSGRITCGFGYRESPTAGASTYHKGIDIGASSGSNIVAAKAGTVVTASYNVAAGNYIMISHGDGVYTVYMHCSKLLVSVGDTVSRGEVIALVGSTGFSTGPHLHFGVSINGSYVDPQKYVSP